MRLETLQGLQREYFPKFMDSLARRCREKYLDSARLMEVENQAVEQVRELTQDGPIGLLYLVPVYFVLCDRFNSCLFSPQENLFKNPREEQDARFCRYLWHCVIPRLLQSDDIVRNVLRAVRGIPCTSQEEAANALKQAAAECSLPAFEELRYNAAEVL